MACTYTYNNKSYTEDEILEHIELNIKEIGEKIDININDIQLYLHEFAHPFLQHLRDNKPAHYRAGIKLLETNSEEAQQYMDLVSRTQPNLRKGSQEFYEEVLAEIISSNGIKLIDANKNNSILQWLKDFWKIIKEQLNLFELTPSDISNMTLREFANIVNASLYTQDEIIEKLIDLNIIQRVC